MMNTIHPLRSAAMFGLLWIASLSLQAQITTDNSLTPEELVALLVGPDVQVSGVEFAGDSLQMGAFENNNGNLTISAGIVLSSGNIEELTGPNDNGGTTGVINGQGGYDDLQTLANINTNDAAILKFDFVATGDSLTFNYSFGSEEYNEYVCSAFNDVFGLFLSGPGIDGPFTDGGINLATVPGTDNIPVSIHTINNGTVGASAGGSSANCDALDSLWQDNAVFYFDNVENFSDPFNPNPNADPNATQMDGFTVTLTAGAVLQCGETYTLRFAIADGSDGSLDSVVLLEAGSFSAGSVDLNADAVPLAADGLQNIVPYNEAVGLPDVFTYENGESFPYTAWSDDNTILVEVDGENVQVDAVVIEGCNDAQFTVVRPEIEVDLLDTLYLGLAGSALLGLDYNESFNEVIMFPGQTSSNITLGVKDDGFDEGVETVEITFEYVNGCGETVITSSRVVILDAMPVEAVPSAVSCLNADGTQTLGYDDISGYGPFRFVWDGNEWNNAAEEPSDWVTSFDSLFSMTNGEGQLISTHNIELTVIDQCNKPFVFEQIVYHPVITETEICFEDRQDFPMFNAGIPIVDLLLDGESVIDNDVLGDTLMFDITSAGTTLGDEDLWQLNAIESGTFGWERVLTMVDSCGFETDALLRVRDCEIPNVFTPNNDSRNDNFRIRGLNGLMGTKLVVYNRYGTKVFEDETTSDAEFELVWNGRHNNGNPAAEGTYQWVLIRPDGISDRGQLTLIRQR